MQSVLRFLIRRWFLLGLVSLITLGLCLGRNLTAEQLARLTDPIDPRTITFLVLFLMAFSLDGRRLQHAFRSPGPVIWASLVNFGVIPLLAIPLMRLQRTPDFAFGLMIAASVPCTMAAAAVWTRRAGGNDAVALLVTLVTNGLCFLLTPFWLNLTVSGREIALDPKSMILRLATVALLPTVAAQLIRLRPSPARFADRYKRPIGVVAQLCVLSIVFVSACNAGAQLNTRQQNMSLFAVLLVWATCVVVHLVALVVGLVGGRKLGFRHPERAAIAFAGSQKTLPIGVYLASDRGMFGNPDFLGPGLGIPFAVFPMLMYHASQLVIDTGIADVLAHRAGREPEATENQAAQAG